MTDPTKKLVLATVLAGSIGLAGLGIARAQSDVDMPLADISSSTAVTANEQDTTTSSDCPMRHRGMMHEQALEKQAELFNMTVDELQSELDAGKPMYQIAAEHGVTASDLQADRLNELQTRLDDMVSVGYLTQEQADQALQQAQEAPVMGFEFGPGHHGFPGMR